ncbi:hypothetical protein [Persephonella sp.]
MYRPEIVLKATDKLIGTIKSDWKKFNEYRKKAVEFLSRETGLPVVSVNEYVFQKPYFWVELPQKVVSFSEAKKYLMDKPYLPLKRVEEEDCTRYAYLSVDTRYKKGKQLLDKWKEFIRDYEKPVVRYLAVSYVPEGVRIHQIDEENLLAFLPQNKKELAEKLIQSGDFEKARIKLV